VRTAYLGTSAFAAAVLERLAESPHSPSIVISRPDAPSGRGRKLTAPPVVTVARALGIEVLQPESVNSSETLERITAAGAETVVVCAFGALIKEPLLSALPIFNVHPSRLPRWRGAAPIERAILAGDTWTGVSIMQLTAGLDSGPVYATRSVRIHQGEDFSTLSHHLQEAGAELLIKVLDKPGKPKEQPQEGITYAEKITAEDRRLDPLSGSALELSRRVRALAGHIGTYLELDGVRLGVTWALPGNGRLAPGELDLGGPKVPPSIGCREGVLDLLFVQPPGKQVMDARAWARGLRR
jgi:methionyl-tRNA formyltransferase